MNKKKNKKCIYKLHPVNFKKLFNSMLFQFFYYTIYHYLPLYCVVWFVRYFPVNSHFKIYNLY